MAGTDGEKRGKKRARDDGAATYGTNNGGPPAWSQVDERYRADGTFTSVLLAWNGVCQFTRKRFVPYAIGGTAAASKLIHGIMVTCLGSRGGAARTPWTRGTKLDIMDMDPRCIRPCFFCPTLRFTKPVAEGLGRDDINNKDLSGYAQYNQRRASAARRFGNRKADQAPLKYSAYYEGKKLEYLYVMAARYHCC
jgi:hypothetical protein